MKIDRLKTFKQFVEREILPATAELKGLTDENCHHLQKLAYTNLVDSFDLTIDETILDNCQENLVVAEAFKILTQQGTHPDLLQILLHSVNLQSGLETKLREGLQYTVLGERHSIKLKILFDVFKPKERYWNKPRVNIATGNICNRMKHQQKLIPSSICGYADWLYARRNAIVHGGGTMEFLENDKKQLNKLFHCTPAKAVWFKRASVKIAATFYTSVIDVLVS